jgi:hypothetical protein
MGESDAERKPSLRLEALREVHGATGTNAYGTAGQTSNIRGGKPVRSNRARSRHAAAIHGSRFLVPKMMW